MVEGCIPRWHDQLVAFATDTRNVTRCPVRADGYVPCSPEDLRAGAQQFLRAAGAWSWSKALPIDVYSIARNIRSEWGSGPVEAKVGIAEAARNEARRRGISPTQLLLINEGRKPLYGRQVQGRWAGTSSDPTVGDIRIAAFVLADKTDDFARGATKYLHPPGMPSQKRLFEVLNDWMQKNVWVGSLPGLQTIDQIMLRPATVGPAEAMANATALNILRHSLREPQPTTLCPAAPSTLLRVAGIGLASAAVVAAAAFFLTSEVAPAAAIRQWAARA